MPTFSEVPAKVDFPAMERKALVRWDRDGTVERYLHRNDGAPERFSFLDGPITANNPMGVHHAWGRTYKDLFQRFQTMLGKEQRYQNGFDCQGLWVEVEVEKELGLRSKRDIETYGIAAFVERCKERVWTFAARQTEQSIRLGYWMDWDNSYYTMSDENNYTIWHVLKTCHKHGWIYKGHDVMPWCPRCGTGISNQEIITEGYQELTHLSVFVRFPLDDEPDAYLLVWTTTPWTLTANVAVAVHPELTYVRAIQDGKTYYLAKDAVKSALRGQHEVVAELSGADLIGRTYRGPFDDLPAATGVRHRVIPWDEVDAAEGTGIVHIAPGCGKEDFGLSKEHDLQVLAPINEAGIYVDGYGWLSGQYVNDVGKPIADHLKQVGLLYRQEQYRHRYPVCWRCGTDLVFRLVDEWFIAMDPLRPRLMEFTRSTRWVPAFGMDRELDWLTNMDDWMISKKRYWGLALPIFECKACGAFEVIGSETELKERAVAGWEEFEGHTPHRPWIDVVKISCANCGETVGRIPDVGNPWLDAGIVAFSTLNYRHDRDYWRKWYPADLITESFPGQFRNWFYAVLAESGVLTDEAPYKAVFSYALMRDEKGEEMHKSKGNAIWFDDAAEIAGVDTMRWLFSTVNPSTNLNFGFNVADEVRRRFILPLWNSYSFFVTYARLDGFDPTDPEKHVPLSERTLLDRWVISRLQQVISLVRQHLLAYEPHLAAAPLEHFVVEELSNWYIRRNRRRFWKAENDRDKAAAYQTLYEVLVSLSGLLAPFIPFVTDEMYRNLVLTAQPDAAPSVHLTDYPEVDPSRLDQSLNQDVATVLEIVRLGRAARTEAGVKVRQPLPALLVYAREAGAWDALRRFEDQILDELNVKALTPLADAGEVLTYDVRPNLSVLGPRYGKRLAAIRQALGRGDISAIAAQVRNGDSISLALDDGSTVELEPSELLVDLLKKPGYAAAQSSNSTVVLDTTITPALVAEGIARDFVRGVQDARKNAGYQIEDTIAIVYLLPDDLAAAVRAYASYITAETLAVRLEPAGPDDLADGLLSGTEWHRDIVKLGDARGEIALRRASR